VLASPLLSSNLGAALSQVAARVRASVAEVHSRSALTLGILRGGQPRALLVAWS